MKMKMSNVEPAGPTETSLATDLAALVRHWLGGRRGLIGLGAAAGAAGLWLGWPSLVAAGLAPLVLGVLPCVAMCALGLCMKGDGKSSDHRKETDS